MAVAVVNIQQSSDLNGGNFAVTLPGSRVNGNILIAIVALSQNRSATWPAGWNELYDANGTDVSSTAAYRVIDGSEGSTVTVTWSSSHTRPANAFVYQISGAGTPQGATPASGTSATPDPPNLAPSGGSDSYLWLATFNALETAGTINSAPTDFTNMQTFSNNTAEGIRHASAERQFTGSSLNPGTFGIGSSTAWVAATIAVPPSSTAYTLACALGTFTLTGVAATLRWGRSIVAAVGSFVLSGQATMLRWGRSIAAAVGEFILTGIAATLTAVLNLAAAAGTFVLTGQAVALTAVKALVAAVGTFTLTGIDAALRTGKNFAAEVGEFILSGVDATFLLAKKMAAAVGAFILSGQAVDFISPALKIIAAVGSFILATPVAVVLSYVQAAAAGLARFAKRRRVKPALNDRRASAPLLTRLRRNH